MNNIRKVLTISFCIALGIIFLVGFIANNKSEPKSTGTPSELIGSIGELLDNTKSDNTDISFMGMVDDKENGNYGRAEYRYNQFLICFDPMTSQLLSIRNEDKLKQIDDDISEEELQRRAVSLYGIVCGEQTAKNSKWESLNDGMGVLMTFNYVSNGVSSPSASIYYTSDGILASADFLPIYQVSDDRTSKLITKDISYDLAKAEAERFIHEKTGEDPVNFRLLEDAVEGHKITDIKGILCWEWKLEYGYCGTDKEEDYYMNPVFTIRIDAMTGEVVQNGNNYT